MKRNDGAQPDAQVPLEPTATTPRGRLLAALSVFLTILALGAYFALSFDRSQRAPKAPPDSPARTAEEPLPAKLFYEGIGTAPVRENEAPAGSEASTYTLELHLTDSREKAESMIASFHDQGIEAYFTPLSRSGRVVYRVRYGIFADEASAQRAQVALKSNHKLGAKVVRLQ